MNSLFKLISELFAGCNAYKRKRPYAITFSPELIGMLSHNKEDRDAAMQKVNKRLYKEKEKK